MAWSKIYYGSFEENVNHDRIDIYIKQLNFAGEPSALLLDGNPVVITYPSKEFDSQIFGCGCEINIVNDTGNFYQYDTLFSVPERSNYVEIIKTPVNGDASIFLFQGYILPDLYSSKISKNISLTIPATDRLTTLDRYTPALLVDTSSYRSDEYINANDLIQNVLVDADVTDKFAINNMLYNTNYIKDGSSSVFDNIMFQSDNFYDKDNVEDDKKCLEKILKPFYSRIFYYNNKFHIERVSDLGRTNKQYALYDFDVSTQQWDVSNNKIELSAHNVLADPELTYNPGYNKMVVNLKYKKPSSLVENYFYDIQPLDLSTASNAKRPRPQQRRWMVSDKSLTTYVNGWDGFFTVPNTSCWTWPITWNPDFTDPATQWMYSGIWSTGQKRAEWGDDQTLTTMFQFSPPGPTESAILSIKYKVSIDTTLQSGSSGTSFQTRFALRSVDKNGNDWWVAKSNYNDTSTYFRNSIYTFDVSISRNDLLADNPRKTYMLWEISKEVDITGALTNSLASATKLKQVTVYNGLGQQIAKKWVTQEYQVPSASQYVGYLYLDVYMTEKTIPTTGYLAGFNPYYSYLGDFDVDLQTTTPKAYLEASMGYFYNTLTKDLDIFDSSTINFTNGNYNCDPSLVLRSVGGWRDSSLDNYVSLQYKYMEELAQMVDKPKYKFNVDVRSKDSSLWNLGNIYTHQSLKYPNGDLMEFMCNGLQYNVKENTYRLDLLEYIDDDSWRVDPINYYFSIDTSSIAFNYLGNATDKIVDLSTNLTGWVVSTSEAWIDPSVSGSGPRWYYSMNLTTNSGDRRDGSVWFVSNDVNHPNQVVSIRQDPSSSAYIEFDINGVINISSPIAVDVSLHFNAYAGACNYGDAFTAYADIYYDGFTEGQASANPNEGECDYDNVDAYKSVLGMTDASNDNVSFNGSSYNAGQTGEQFSSGFVKITSAKVSGTAIDVSLHSNRIEWDYSGIVSVYHEE